MPVIPDVSTFFGCHQRIPNLAGDNICKGVEIKNESRSVNGI